MAPDRANIQKDWPVKFDRYLEHFFGINLPMDRLMSGLSEIWALAFIQPISKFHVKILID